MGLLQEPRIAEHLQPPLQLRSPSWAVGSADAAGWLPLALPHLNPALASLHGPPPLPLQRSRIPETHDQNWKLESVQDLRARVSPSLSIAILSSRLQDIIRAPGGLLVILWVSG